MCSKLIVFLGLLLAMVLLISSQVAAARELAEATTTNASKEDEETNEAAANDAKNDLPPNYHEAPYHEGQKRGTGQHSGSAVARALQYCVTGRRCCHGMGSGGGCWCC